MSSVTKVGVTGTIDQTGTIKGQVHGSDTVRGNVRSTGSIAGSVLAVGPPGPPGPPGEDYILTDADKLEIANLVLDTEEMVQLISDVADLKYVPIDIISISNTVDTIELGDTLTEVTVRWSVNKTPKTQTINGSSIDAALREKSYTGLSVSFDKQTNVGYTVAVTDERDHRDTATTNVQFLNGVYYGAAPIPSTLDRTFILGLSSKVLSSTKSLTINVTASAGQYIWYALPSRLGKCTFTVGGFEGGFTLVNDSFAFENAHGCTETYYVYRSTNIVPGTTKVVIS